MFNCSTISTITTLIIVIIVNLSSTNSSSMPSSTLESLICSPGWMLINATYKCILAKRMQQGTFDQALSFCENLSSSMLTIDSKEENDEVSKTLDELVINRFWIGGKTFAKNPAKVDKEKISVKWMLTRKSNDYANWGNGSPSCSSSEECCVYVNSLFEWHDLDCDEELFFVCQKDSSLSPKTFDQLTKVDDDDINADSIDPNCFANSISKLLIIGIHDNRNKSQVDEVLNTIEINLNVSSSTSLVTENQTSTTPIPSSESVSPITAATATPTSTAQSVPTVVTVPEELINKIIHRYQKNQLQVIKQWFELVREHRNSRQKQSQQSMRDTFLKEIQWYNYSLLILTGILIFTLIVTMISFCIGIRIFYRKQEENILLNTSEMSSRYLEKCYD